MIYKAVINEEKKDDFFAYLKELHVPEENTVLTNSRGNVLLYDIILNVEDIANSRDIWHKLGDKVSYFL